jgi:hypothetical protein
MFMSTVSLSVEVSPLCAIRDLVTDIVGRIELYRPERLRFVHWSWKRFLLHSFGIGFDLYVDIWKALFPLQDPRDPGLPLTSRQRCSHNYVKPVVL